MGLCYNSGLALCYKRRAAAILGAKGFFLLCEGPKISLISTKIKQCQEELGFPVSKASKMIKSIASHICLKSDENEMCQTFFCFRPLNLMMNIKLNHVSVRFNQIVGTLRQYAQ